jgi:hypothetical protein
MWAKILLILTLHGSATFDAWSTNRVINGSPPGFPPGREGNPIMRPFAGKPTMYLVSNLSVIPLDVWILSHKRQRASKIVAGGYAGWLGFLAVGNVRRLNSARDDYRRAMAVRCQWDPTHPGCAQAFGLNPADPAKPPW